MKNNYSKSYSKIINKLNNVSKFIMNVNTKTVYNNFIQLFLKASKKMGVEGKLHKLFVLNSLNKNK